MNLQMFPNGGTRGLRLVWIPIPFFIASTIVMTWPLSIHLNTHFIGPGSGDNWYYVWLIGWFQRALFELQQNPQWVSILNAPEGWNLAYSEITFSNVAIALPVSLAAGSTFGYNFALLLSFILSGLVVYWWVLSLTQNVAAAFVGGTLFAFAPYRLAHAYGHLPSMGTEWLALYFWGLDSLLRQRSRKWHYAAMSGVGLGLAALSSMYYLYMSLVISVVYILGYLLIVEHKAVLRITFWQNLVAVGLVALPFLLGALLPYVQLSLQGDANHRRVEDVDAWSASPTDFVLPAPVQPIWGSWIQAHFDRSRWIEQTLYLGIVGIELAIVAFVRREHMLQHARKIALLAWSSACGIILAMGMTLHWLGQQVTWNVPFSPSPISARLPSYWMFQVLPFYDGMRVWMRYGIFVDLFVAVLAGLGFAYLTRFLPNRWISGSVLALVLVLIGVDFFTGFPLSEVQARPVDEWLASQPGTGAVVEFPIVMSLNPQVIYGTLLYRKPFIGMFYGAYLPASFRRIMPILSGFPDEGSVRLLRERGVQYVVVDSLEYRDWAETREKIETLGLIQTAEIYDQYVYKFSSP